MFLSTPGFFVQHAVEFDPASEAALTSLFFATGFGAYLSGAVGEKLERLDDDNQPPPTTASLRTASSQRAPTGRNPVLPRRCYFDNHLH